MKVFRFSIVLLLFTFFPIKEHAEKIAVISDIHGNYPALTAVLEDIQEQKVDKIICLGDIVSKGPDPSLVLEKIRKVADIIIVGNCDIKAALNSEPEYTGFTYKELNEEQKNFLLNLPVCYDAKISGRNVRFFHATPFSLDQKVCRGDELSEHSKLIDRISMFKNSPFLNKDEQSPLPDVVIYGHIHSQFMQKIAGRTLINVGSVGNSLDFETFFNSKKKAKDKIPYLPQKNRAKFVTQANYIIIEGGWNENSIDKFSITFKEVNYNKNLSLVRAKNKVNFPFLNDYVCMIENGMYSS